MVMSCDLIAGRRQNIKIDNSSFERVEEFKYLGTMQTNQNSIQEEIKKRLHSENVCYISVQNLLSSSLLSKNLKTTLARRAQFCSSTCFTSCSLQLEQCTTK